MTDTAISPHLPSAWHAAVFQMVTDAIVIADPTGPGRVLAVNPAACKLFGYTEAEFLQLFRTDLLDPADARVQTMLATREASRHVTTDLQYRRKDGRSFVGELTSTVYTDATGAPRAVTIIRDISARKNAEEALRLSEEKFAKAFTANPAAIALTRLTDGRFLDVNDTYLGITGFLRSEVIGRTAGDLGAWPRAEDRSRFVAALRQHGSLRGWEERFRKKSGEEFHALLSAEVITVGGEDLVLSTYLDITARKRADEALRYAHAQLERRVEERTLDLAKALAKQAMQADQLRTLTGDLAVAEQRERQRLGQVLHDGLQQFLVAARLRVELLGRAADPAQVPAACRDVLALLHDAIAASRSLTAELSPPILFTAGFVPALGWLARWMQDTHHLTVHLTADPTAEPGQEPAKVLLFQSVRELLFNAVKHAGVLEATVAVTRQGECVQILVADHGNGFDPARLQAGGTSGFGLPSIQQRLEYLGGTFAIASAPGQGSRFTLTVPVEAGP
jgi:PAS domain S-box-containing protein